METYPKKMTPYTAAGMSQLFYYLSGLMNETMLSLAANENDFSLRIMETDTFFTSHPISNDLLNFVEKYLSEAIQNYQKNKTIFDSGNARILFYFLSILRNNTPTDEEFNKLLQEGI